MPNYPDRRPKNEDEVKARARSTEIELNILLAVHGLEEYSPYISIDDEEHPSYHIESGDKQQSYAASVWLTPFQPWLYWIATGWTTNEQGEKTDFQKYNFDTRQNALLFILKKFQENGFAPRCEWTQWKDNGNGGEERECRLCPKVEVRYLEE